MGTRALRNGLRCPSKRPPEGGAMMVDLRAVACALGGTMSGRTIPLTSIIGLHPIGVTRPPSKVRTNDARCACRGAPARRTAPAPYTPEHRRGHRL